jgi:hypothetical protein
VKAEKSTAHSVKNGGARNTISGDNPVITFACDKSVEPVNMGQRARLGKEGK